MSEHRLISPMLDGFQLGDPISDHHGVSCCPAMKEDSDKRYIVKKISVPASQVQVDALLLTGICKDAKAAQSYFEERSQGILEEAQTLEKLAAQRGFVPYSGCQTVPMEDGVGCEVYLLSRYRRTLERYLKRNAMTHLGAVNLGIDMCAALAVSREAGWLYVDLKPGNIYLFNDQEYRVGDLGFVSMDALDFASLPDRYRSLYTVPEVVDAYSSLNATMDTYALGLVLYQVYNCGKLPFETVEERAAALDNLAAPKCADEQMASIILKACAKDPADRWQTPAEMGHALISYMQTVGAEDVPIEAPAEPEPEAPVEAEPEQAVDAVVSEAGTEEAPAEEVPLEEAPVEEAPVEDAPAEEAPVEDAPVEEAPVEDAPVEDAPVEDAPVEEAPAEEICESEAEPEIPVLPVTEPESEADLAEVLTAALDDLDQEELPEDPDQLQEEEYLPDPEVSMPEEAEEPEEEPEMLPADEPQEEEEDDIPSDWIDLMDAILAEDKDESDSDEPSLRQLLETGDSQAAEPVSDEDVSAETADMLSIAQELIEHEAPPPVVAPEAIEVPMPEPIVIELPSDEEPEAEGVLPIELPEEDEEEAAPAPVIPEEKPKSGLWKKILGTVIGLAVTAGLAFGAWYYYSNYYLQTIDSMTYDCTGTQVTVYVETAMEQSQLTVICKDTYGNAVKGKLENGSVTFTDLVPGSQYIISLEPDGFNKLVGSTSVTCSTPAETQVINLTAVTGQEAGTAIVSFGVEGLDSEEWTLTCTAEGLEDQSIAFTGHTVTIPELSIGTEYTFTLSAPEEILLVGETSVVHTASELVQAQNLSLADYADGVITVSWNAPEGVSVERWFVRCYNASGYDTLLEVTEPSAQFSDITEGGSYTLEVTAAGMTLATRTEIVADANNITGFAAVLKGSTIELSWNYGGPIPEDGWKIAWSADGGAEQLLTAQENKATLSPAAPGSTYTFTIQPPEGTNLLGGTATVEIPAASAFSANKLDSESIIVEMFQVPSKSSWTYATLQRSREQDTFQAGGQLALLYTVTKPYNFDSSTFETIFVIRDAEGKLVSASAVSRSWDDMWDNGYCTETVQNLPAAPGSYTLTIYLGGGELTQLPFTIQ